MNSCTREEYFSTTYVYYVYPIKKCKILPKLSEIKTKQAWYRSSHFKRCHISQPLGCCFIYLPLYTNTIPGKLRWSVTAYNNTNVNWFWCWSLSILQYIYDRLLYSYTSLTMIVRETIYWWWSKKIFKKIWKIT